MTEAARPLLPLVLHRVPRGLRRYALAQEGIAAVDHAPDAASGRFVLYDSRETQPPELHSGQTLIDVDCIRASQPDDPFEQLEDSSSQRHAWQIGGLTIQEEIARVDKRAVRRRVLDHLRATIESHGGVWLRLSAFPFPYRSVFNFRIDHDDYDAGDFERLLVAIGDHEHATSHYLCGSTHANWPDAVERLKSLDVGSHGYWHHVYSDQEENHRNVQRGIEFLLAAGIAPSGFVAPHGRFNHGLLTVLESLGVTHSSEFGLAYDELPYFPFDRSVLQIPIHPICLGLFVDLLKHRPELSAQRVVRAATDYFIEVAETKYRAGEPILLYCHPTERLGRYPQVLKEVFECVGGFGALWQTTLTEFAGWWRARQQVSLTVERVGAEYLLTATNLPGNWRVGVELLRGEHVALLPVEAGPVQFSPQALAWQTRPRSKLPEAIRIDAPHSLKRSLLRYLDWERVTPVDEIAATSFRGWAKRTLRKLRA